MKVAGIRSESLMEGDGVNLVVFTQGCHINCPGCHNKSLQDPNGGVEMEPEELLKYVTPITTGIVVSGGEPTEQWLDVLVLADLAKEKGLQTTLFTGHTLEYLMEQPYYTNVLKSFDRIKVGPYVESLRTTTCGPMGSTNQATYVTALMREE